MKITKKISEMSIPGAIVLSGLIIGLSVFLTTWVFFGGDNNRQKFFISNPSINRNPQQINTLTPQQLQMLQQQRAAMMAQQASSTNQQAPAGNPAPTPAPIKQIKK